MVGATTIPKEIRSACIIVPITLDHDETTSHQALGNTQAHHDDTEPASAERSSSSVERIGARGVRSP